MSSIMTALSTVVSSVASMVSSWVGVITASGNEIILVFVLLPLVGIGIGALKRLLRG